MAPPSKYYIYSSKVLNPLSGNDVLTQDTSADDFVSALDDQLIVLQDAPAAVTGESSLLSSSIDSSDKWYQWLVQLDSSSTFSGTLSVFLQASDKSVDSFRFEVKRPCHLVFSSSTAVLAKAFGPPPLVDHDSNATITTPGLDSQGKMLYCGFDKASVATVQTVAVADVFKYAGLSGLISRVPTFLTQLSITLDPSTTDGQHNALWFNPTSSYTTVVRLQFNVVDQDSFKNYFARALPGLNFTTPNLVCKKIFVRARTDQGLLGVDNGRITFTTTCIITPSSGPSANLTAAVEFQENNISLTLMTKTSDTLTSLLTWLGDRTNQPDLVAHVDQLLNADTVLSAISLRRVNLVLDTTDNPEAPVLMSFSIDIEVSVGNPGPNSPPTIFLLTYGWVQGGDQFGFLQGRLWTMSDTSTNQDLNPYYEAWDVLQPSKTPASSIDLTTVIPGETIANVPDNIPTQITSATLFLSKSTFQIGAVIESSLEKPAPSGTIPQPYLGKVVLDASYTRGQKSAFTASIGISAGLTPSPTSPDPTPATLVGTLTYNRANGANSWKLTASLNGLYASSLYQFFAPDSADHVMPLIDSIEIGSLNLDYEYGGTALSNNPASNAVPSAPVKSIGSVFDIEGDLFIASLELKLKFHYDLTSGWYLRADLTSTTETETLGNIIAGVLGDSNFELPPFLSDMTFGGPQSSDAINIVVKKILAAPSPTKTKPTPPRGDVFQFIATVTIKKLSLTFAQYHNGAWPSTAPSKRMVKVTLKNFMSVTVPLVGDITQPFDEMYYLWMQDATDLTTSKIPGFTRQEMADLNQSLADQVIYKDDVKDKADTDVVVAGGSHFAIIIKDSRDERSCVLDYNFGKPKTGVPSKANGPPSEPVATNVPTPKQPADPESDDAESAQAPLKKKAGPLNISNISLKLSGSTLAIKFDATFELGPLGFSLLGFSIDLTFETLDAWSIGSGLEGLSVAFEEAPLTIAGIIRHGSTGSIDYYAGGLIVGFTPYLFEAAGFYGTSDKPPKFTSVFVFARLDGPLVSLEFAEISGITGGIGYNSNVRIPAVAEVASFPFIDTQILNGQTGSALDALQALVDPGAGGWFSPQNNSFWAAAGLKIDAFQMLSIDAVLLVQFGNSIQLGLFAVAVADVPDSLSTEKFAHVELGISIVVDFTYGTMKAEAQLTPRSYILDPNCHLTGGMALYYWFDAPHADQSNVGSFVFTLGGYHQAFPVPDGWPNPPRLAVNWSISNNISISGEAYFAITPKVCMGGGRLHASFSAGPIEAFFDAFIDFLINYKPFHFLASGGLSVGVRFNLDILFVHTHISVEIGATLTVWGPPLAGRVHVDFWITAFDIDFGDSPQDIPSIDLLAFYLLVLQASQKKSDSAAKPQAIEAPRIQEVSDAEADAVTNIDPRPENEAHNFLAQSGLLNDSTGAEKLPNAKWVVRGGTFSLLINCTMAIDKATCGKKKDGTDNSASYTDNSIYSRPMKLSQPLTSTMAITITQDGVPSDDSVWGIEGSTKTVPDGLWGQYNASTDPTGGNNNLPDLLGSSQRGVTLMMGVSLTAPPAQVSSDPLPPFNIAKANLQNLPAAKNFPPVESASKEWEAATPAEGSAQWDAVHSAWKTPSFAAADPKVQTDFVTALIQAFGFALDAFDDAAGVMQVGMPPNLDKGFDDLYVVAPMITV